MKQEQIKYKENEQGLREILNLMTDVIFELDKNGTYLYIAPTSPDLLIKPSKELLGRKVSDVFSPDLAQLFLDSINNCLENNKSDIVTYSINLSGRDFWFEGKVVPKTKTSTLFFARDITQRVLAQKELVKLSSALDQSPVAISISDLQGEIEYVNPIYTKITGYSIDELKSLGRANFRADFETIEDFYQAWNVVSDGQVWKGEFLKHRKNGDIYWERVSISPINSSIGEIINYVRVAEDISEIKQNEFELKKALSKAEESDRLKSAFLSNMSHEIRTPMNGVLGFTELLKDSDLTDKERIRYINIIEKSGNRMLDTINDIIDVARIEAGQEKIVLGEISLNDKLKELYDFFYKQAENKALELSFELSPELCNSKIVTDSHKLDSILINLIKNAIKFTDQGEVKFGCRSLGSETGRNELEFYVIDSGIGIPDDRIKAVFNRFEQADLEDKKVYQGSGLGLTISKAYVEMMKGSIKVKSQEGFGSTFVFTIPHLSVDTDASMKAGKNGDSQYNFFQELNILVAEDDQTSIMLYKKILQNRFKSVHFTRNGKETLDFFNANPEIDLILMDVKMPLIDGFEVTRIIRMNNSQVKIIAQTAFGLSTEKEKALRIGCNDYLSKPVSKKRLFEKISSLYN